MVDIESIYIGKEPMSDPLGITIQSMCYQCQALVELCPDCLEAKDARDIELAHQIVDESDGNYISTFAGTVLKAVPSRTVANGGSVAEFNPLSIIRDLPSGHDWTEREGELLEPISMLIDRIYDLETSVTVTRNETICQDCHYTHNKAIACPNCN